MWKLLEKKESLDIKQATSKQTLWSLALESLSILFVCVCAHTFPPHQNERTAATPAKAPLGCGPRLPALLFTIERHSGERKERAEPADLTQSRPYLCQQKTRLNFPPESPMTRADITGGYSPCLLPRPYKTHSIRYGEVGRSVCVCVCVGWRGGGWAGRGVKVAGRTAFCFRFFFFLLLFTSSQQQWDFFFVDKQSKVRLGHETRRPVRVAACFLDC